MAINYRKRVLLKEDITKRCKECKKIYPKEHEYCKTCGKRLTSEKTKVYANFGKSGITSISYVLPDKTTINSKGNVTFPLANGLSYTTNLR